MYVIALILIIFTFSVIIYERRYFKFQREKCQKYPFFKFRDKVIYEIISSKDFSSYEDLYEKSNWVIESLNRFDFKFYSDVSVTVFHKIIEEAYKNNWVIDDDLLNRLKTDQLFPLKREFTTLLLDVAKSNSMFLRFFMTNFGYRIFFNTHMFKAALKFAEEHPEYIETNRPERKISTLNRIERKISVTRNFSFMSRIAAAI